VSQLESINGRSGASGRPAPSGTRPSDESVSAPEPVDVYSKTVVPTVQPGTVPRPGLVNRLRAASADRLVTLVAPAGYGKTTLLAQWAERDDRPLGWVSLDDGDDAPALLRCVIAALSRIGSLDDADHERLASGRGLDAAGLPRLSCILGRAPEPFVLVVDDVQTACSSASAAVLATLVRHLPEGSTLALSGRMLPRLPIARLRAEGRMLEVGVEELALSRRDAQLLLRAVRPELDEADAAELSERTEGWPAGLHLAGLVLRDGTGHRRPVSEFTGEDRFVADYFGLEHLSRLDRADLDFLTRSSILESMCAALCDVVVGGARDSTARLDALEGASLFVVPLDRHRGWYRYHRLFRETLRAELARREPELVPALYRRAAAWCEANGEFGVARRYAAAAGDLNMVARLVAMHALPAYADGLECLDGWLDGLGDPALLERHPGTAAVGSWIHALGGRAEHAALWFQAAESGEGASTIRPQVAFLRAAFCREGADRMLADAEAAVGSLPWTSPWRPTGVLLCGIATLLGGETERADALFAEADELAAGVGAADVRRLALAERLLLAEDAGDRPRAQELASALRGVIGERGHGPYAPAAIELAALARSDLRSGSWPAARAALDDAAALVPRLTHALPWCAVQALLELARGHMAILDTSTAGTLLSRAEGILERRPMLGVLVARTRALRAELTALSDLDGRREAMLTPAELRLLPLLGTRLSFREIGERLHVSRNTVKTQAIAVYRKLGVSSRNDAVDRAAELGLADRPSGA
jgi:LuxR family transcriptional regulator, maltose regulon positive regulatory protein